MRKLAEQLESESIDGSRESRKLSVFFDKWDIAAGQSLIDRMNQGMAAARHDWFIHPDKRLWLMALLNTSLSSHMKALRMKNDGKGRFLFLPEAGGGDRRWPMPGRKKGPAVAAKKMGKDGVSSFWVRHGATLCFKRVGVNLFISVEPHYLFTLDGSMSVNGKSAGKLATIWGGKQQNPDILRNVLFWGIIMAKNEKEIRIATGAEPIVVGRVPATVQIDVGIAFEAIW